MAAARRLAQGVVGRLEGEVEAREREKGDAVLRARVLGEKVGVASFWMMMASSVLRSAMRVVCVFSLALKHTCHTMTGAIPRSARPEAGARAARITGSAEQGAGGGGGGERWGGGSQGGGGPAEGTGKGGVRCVGEHALWAQPPVVVVCRCLCDR